jgi:hypothetical protein
VGFRTAMREHGVSPDGSARMLTHGGSVAHAHLSLAQVHAALAYYHANAEEIETDLAEEEAFAEMVARESDRRSR